MGVCKRKADHKFGGVNSKKKKQANNACGEMTGYV